MGARQKLNQAYATGSVFFAAVVGLITGSWLVFVIALAVLLAMNVSAGEIRPSKRNHR